MNAKQFRDALDHLGLTQMDASRLLGVDGRTVRRWVAGDIKIPGPAEMFLRYLILTGRTGEQAMRKLKS